MLGDLVLNFFADFSRFEYALKAAGKVRTPPERDDAQANWGHVTQTPKDLRQKTPNAFARIKATAGILMTVPPCKQVWVNGQLLFRRPGSAGDEAKDLVDAVGRVRNNLFHGGKYSAAGDLGQRDEELIRCARAVLQELLELPELKDVAEKYRSNEPVESETKGEAGCR